MEVFGVAPKASVTEQVNRNMRRNTGRGGGLTEDPFPDPPDTIRDVDGNPVYFNRAPAEDGLAALKTIEQPAGNGRQAREDWPHGGYLAAGVAKYLVAVKGVGAKAGARLGAAVERAGATTVAEVAEVAGDAMPAHEAAIADFLLTPYSKGGAGEAWMHEAMLFGLSLGLPKGVCRSAAFEHRYGLRAKVVQGLFDVLLSIRGVGWEGASGAADALGVADDDARRVEAAVLAAVQAVTEQDGSTHVVFADVRKSLGRVCKSIRLTDAQVVEALGAMVERGRLRLRERRWWPAPLWRAERGAAAHVRALAGGAGPPGIEVDLDGLSADQEAAMRSLAAAPVTVLTGGPGTGKTFVISRLARAAVAQGQDVGLCALAGRAAQRMSELSGLDAKTIHRMLGYGGSVPVMWQIGDAAALGEVVEHEGVAYQLIGDLPAGGSAADLQEHAIVERSAGPVAGAAEAKLPKDLLIVDEVSMLGVVLFEKLLKAVLAKEGYAPRLVFVGDVDQLPSIDPGAVMRDLLDCRLIARHRLTQVHRQEGDSMIPVRAQAIQAGTLRIRDCDRDAQPKDDGFRFVACADAEKAAGYACRIRDTLAPKRWGVDPNDVQIITALRSRGSLSCAALNQRCRKRLGRLDPRKLEADDRVIQNQNNYELGVFNGDVGSVVRAGNDGSVRVRFPRRTVDYDRKEARALQFAYAITVHKAQGSEFPVVIVPVHEEQGIMLQRNLLYTAVTRSRLQVVVVGSAEAVERAMMNTKVEYRRSAILDFMEAGE